MGSPVVEIFDLAWACATRCISDGENGRVIHVPPELRCGTFFRDPQNLFLGPRAGLFVRNKIAYGYCARASLRAALRVGAL